MEKKNAIGLHKLHLKPKISHINYWIKLKNNYLKKTKLIKGPMELIKQIYRLHFIIHHMDRQ